MEKVNVCLASEFVVEDDAQEFCFISGVDREAGDFDITGERVDFLSCEYH